jgi:hypothetical protein
MARRAAREQAGTVLAGTETPQHSLRGGAWHVRDSPCATRQWLQTLR